MLKHRHSSRISCFGCQAQSTSSGGGLTPRIIINMGPHLQGAPAWDPSSGYPAGHPGEVVPVNQEPMAPPAEAVPYGGSGGGGGNPQELPSYNSAGIATGFPRKLMSTAGGRAASGQPQPGSKGGGGPGSTPAGEAMSTAVGLERTIAVMCSPHGPLHMWLIRAVHVFGSCCRRWFVIMKALEDSALYSLLF